MVFIREYMNNLIDSILCIKISLDIIVLILKRDLFYKNIAATRFLECAKGIPIKLRFVKNIFCPLMENRLKCYKATT